MIESIFDLPMLFTVTYVCECGEEYEMDNCLVPRLMLPCESCGGQTMFNVSYLVHKSWEWDTIEDDEEALEGLATEEG